MKLYGSLTSPFVRKCRITLLETGLNSQTEFVPVSVMDMTASQPNPLKLVPSFETDKGELIVDSRTICEYLIATGNGALSEASWQDRTLVALADGIMDRSVSITLEKRRPESDQSKDWLDRWANAIRKTLFAVEARRPDYFTPGAIALLCALAYLDLRHSDLNWREGHDDLNDWFQSLSNRPSVVSTEHPA